MIHTLVEGDVSSVTGAATWLRGTLASNLSGAADDCARGRDIASREWEGDDATAYSDYARTVVSMTDAHAARVGRAANSLDVYGARLKAPMDAIRSRAVAGGLPVSGDQIGEPPVVAATVAEPGSAEESAHLKAVEKVDLYNTLSGDTATAWTEFDGWIRANLVPDVTDAEDDSPIDKVLSEVKAAFPNFAAGVGGGFSGAGLNKWADTYRDEARETGDWKRAAITTGTSLAVAGGVALYVATAPGQIYDHWDDTKDLASDAWDGAKDVVSGAKDKVEDTLDAVTPR